jgi:hypothetical protein
MIESSGVARRRRSIAGEGMVTPRKPMTVVEDGKVETLEPGRHRLAVDHELVARNPDKFVACWKRDVKVRSQLCDMIERSRRLGSRRSLPTTQNLYGLGGSALDLTGPSNNYGLGGSLNGWKPDWAL